MTIKQESQTQSLASIVKEFSDLTDSHDSGDLEALKLQIDRLRRDYAQCADELALARAELESLKR